MGLSLKPSRFNCWAENPDGDLLLYNTLEVSFLKIHKAQAPALLPVLEGKQAVPENVNPDLIKLGFFVESNTDELALLKYYADLRLNNPVLELDILPTHQCNCRCVYCYEDFQGPVLSEAHQKKLIKFVSDHISSCSALHVNWFGGEPLAGIGVIRNLSPVFVDMCDKLRKNYSASMTTNGTLLTYDTFLELQKYHVTSFQVTIDGPRSVHDKQRPLVGGGSAYDLVMQNMKDIHTRKHGRTFRILLRVNLTKQCLPDLEDFLVELDANFGKDPRFSLDINVANNWGGDRIDAYKENLLEDEHELDALKKRIFEIITKRELSLHISGYGSKQSFSLGVSGGCYTNSKNYITVDATGKLYKCAQGIRQGFPPLGDLETYERPIDLKVELAKWAASYFPEPPEKCNNCVFLPVGCWGISLCPMIKYLKKYEERPVLSDALCPEERARAGKNIHRIFDEPDCPPDLLDIPGVLNKAAPVMKPPFLEHIFDQTEGEV